MEGTASAQTALVSEITHFSTRDGPGIRTTVFLKGCPLRCKWCSNPETWEKRRQLFYLSNRCTACGACAKVCPTGAIGPRFSSPYRIDRRRCTACGACTKACLHNAFRLSGESCTVDELMRVLERDKCFYGQDGGVTVSGGEPLSSAPFVGELFRRCKESGIGTVLDTTGYGDSAALDEILPNTDLVLLDLKHMDSAAHKKWTGVDNRLILENARRIARAVPVRISLPLIAGVNDGVENIRATAAFAAEIGAQAVDMNPLHTLGVGKYHYLGKRSPYGQFRRLEKSEVDEVAEIFRSFGLHCGVGRMM